jgi:catechol 2,3-dioxygenase-like lactoylglutathione lyase family enzyme
VIRLAPESGADVKIDRLDHLVLTVRDVEATCAFYALVLHMEPVTFAGGRRALRFGHQKLNLHSAEAPIAPHAARPTPGSADLCFITVTPISEVVAHLTRVGVAIEEGPVRRSGATGPMTSVYFRDPDANLIEVSEYDRDA